MYRKFIKRWLDFVLALLLIIILSPLFVILALLVLVFLGTPIIFRQQRPGKDEKIFTLYKFRTMTDKRDRNGKLLSDEKRLTKFGKFLRSTSLDELPELWNILKGDMSFVGPRPLLVEYLSRYNDEQKHRHDVRPGLTGLAQVKGRNAIEWKDKFKYDIEYVKRITFCGDVKIVLMTVGVVFRQSGISHGDSVTMKKFEGESNG